MSVSNNKPKKQLCDRRLVLKTAHYLEVAYDQLDAKSRRRGVALINHAQYDDSFPCSMVVCRIPSVLRTSVVGTAFCFVTSFKKRAR